MFRRFLAFLPFLLFGFLAPLFAQSVKGYDVKSYDATVTLDRSSDSLYGSVTMFARSEAVLSTILQHTKYLTLDNVLVNGSAASVQWVDTAMGVYNVIPSQPIQSGTPFIVRTAYHGHGLTEQDAAKWGGVNDNDTMMFAMGVGFAVPYTSCTRHWLPCYDLPDDKADSVDLTFISPASDITASNGLLISNTIASDRRTMHWHVSHPIASYLMTFATGPYTEAKIPNTLNKPFEVFALSRDSLLASRQMDIRVAKALSFYDSLFAPYPFEKVGYVVTPIGSMEHQTMISLDKHAMDTTYTNTTPVHELAHMWWGDWVTCKTFDDAWLNEGFATYCESLILERFEGRPLYFKRQQANITGAKSNPQYPLYGAASATNHTNNYPYSTIYQKGAAVLGMLRDYLGDSLFFVALRSYGQHHAYSTATSQQLQQDFESATGQDLQWFISQWVYGIGYPQFAVKWKQTQTGANLTFQQTANASAPSYYRLPMTVLGTKKGGLSRRVNVVMDSLQTSSASVDFGFQPDAISIDPDGILLKKMTSLSAVAPQHDFQSNRLTMSIYPNPASRGMAKVTLRTPGNIGMARFSIYDTAGRFMRASEFPSSMDEYAIDLKGLTAGAYTVTVRTSNGLEAAQQITVEP